MLPLSLNYIVSTYVTVYQVTFLSYSFSIYSIVSILTIKLNLIKSGKFHLMSIDEFSPLLDKKSLLLVISFRILKVLKIFLSIFS